MLRSVSTSVFAGPNLYADQRLIRIRVPRPDNSAIEPWQGNPVAQQVAQLIPGIQQRIDNSTANTIHYPRQQLLAWTAVELQRLAGYEVTHAEVRTSSSQPLLDVLYEYHFPDVGLEAGNTAWNILSGITHSLSSPDDKSAGKLVALRGRFIQFAQRRKLDMSTLALVKEAEARNIPWFRLRNELRYIQLGQGKYQKRIMETLTSATSHIGARLSANKMLTHHVLDRVDIPTPAQHRVFSVDEALDAAQRLGYPVVIKPAGTGKGVGITVGINAASAIPRAFLHAQRYDHEVLVESFIAGDDYRLFIVDGEMVAAAKRQPAHISGDGKHSVRELIDITNEDPRRGQGYDKLLVHIDLDQEAMDRLDNLGYQADSVPASGVHIPLRGTANIATGGTAVDVTDIVHPDNRDMAIRAVAALDLDVAGVDFLTTDVTKSYLESGGAICEINCYPGMRVHMVADGAPRDLAGPILDWLFPPHNPGRIPVAAVTGTNGKTTTCRMLAHILKTAGYTPGLTCTDGIYIGDDHIINIDRAGPEAARLVLRHPEVDAAVLETARGGILRAGLGYEQCDVAAVLNIQDDHLGFSGIDTREQMAAVKEVVARSSRNTVVLNADDSLCMKMLPRLQSRTIVYVSSYAENPHIIKHIAQGGRAVVLKTSTNGKDIVLLDGHTQHRVIGVQEIPATLYGLAEHNIENALFATALAVSLSIDLLPIYNSLKDFHCSFAQNPGRTNLYEGHPFRVILDYGHNPHGIGLMCRLVDKLQPGGRRILVLPAPANRNDDYFIDVAQTVAGRFDTYICDNYDDRRGRAAAFVPGKISAGLLSAGVARENIRVIIEQSEAIDAALHMASEGDLVLVFGDHKEKYWRQITEFHPTRVSG